MFKFGPNTIDQLPGTWPEIDFFRFGEEFGLHRFKTKGELPPFSLFWSNGTVLVGKWFWQSNAEKDLAMGTARSICKRFDIKRYLFASEVWMKTMSTDDPDLDSKIKKLNKSGVVNEPDRKEVLMFILETKGQKLTHVQYEILAPGIVGKRLTMKPDETSGRAVGMLD